MGGFFGAISHKNCIYDVFFGTDYHSHLGTRRAGLAFYDQEQGFQRQIHNIENTPFRTKFERDVDDMSGPLGIGCISDTDPQPLLVRSVHGTYAICVVGVIQNEEAIIEQMLGDADRHFEAMSGGRVNSNELVAALLTEPAQPLTQLEVMYGIADSRIDSVEIAAVVVAVLFVRGVDKDFSV